MTSSLLERVMKALSERYRVEREVGSGGMATVYLAEDLRHQRRVAVKVFRPELTATLGGERFFREFTQSPRFGIAVHGDSLCFSYQVHSGDIWMAKVLEP
jgi:serine/threonine protein kinase